MRERTDKSKLRYLGIRITDERYYRLRERLLLDRTDLQQALTALIDSYLDGAAGDSQHVEVQAPITPMRMRVTPSAERPLPRSLRAYDPDED